MGKHGLKLLFKLFQNFIPTHMKFKSPATSLFHFCTFYSDTASESLNQHIIAVVYYAKIRQMICCTHFSCQECDQGSVLQKLRGALAIFLCLEDVQGHKGSDASNPTANEKHKRPRTVPERHHSAICPISEVHNLWPMGRIRPAEGFCRARGTISCNSKNRPATKICFRNYGS